MSLNTPLPVRVEAPGHRHGPISHTPVYQHARSAHSTAITLARLACSLQGDGRSDVLGIAMVLAL